MEDELFSYVHILFRPKSDLFVNKTFPRKIKILYITNILRTSSRSSHGLINAARFLTGKPARKAMVFQTWTFGIVYSASGGMEVGSVSKCACLYLSECDKM